MLGFDATTQTFYHIKRNDACVLLKPLSVSEGSGSEHQIKKMHKFYNNLFYFMPLKQIYRTVPLSLLTHNNDFFLALLFGILKVLKVFI